MNWSEGLVTILGHALWQGAIIAMVAWLTVRKMERPNDRFTVLLIALMATLACPVLTFVVSKTPLIGITVSGHGDSFGWTMALAWLWALGAAGRAVVYTVGWARLRTALRRYARRASPDLSQRVKAISRVLQFSGSITVLESASDIGPATFGVLRHVLVIPASVIARLSPEQLDAILAHEIAHMVRDDFLVSLVQGFAESVLFFHPGVWWISAQLRRERELCCDELAMKYVRSPVTYAEALVGVADLSPLQVSMAATGGSLLARIRHIRAASSARPASRRGMVWLPALALTLVLAGSVAFGSKKLAEPVREPANLVFVTTRPTMDFMVPAPPPETRAGKEVRFIRIVRYTGNASASAIATATATAATPNMVQGQMITVTSSDVPMTWTYETSNAEYRTEHYEARLQ